MRWLGPCWPRRPSRMHRMFSSLHRFIWPHIIRTSPPSPKTQCEFRTNAKNNVLIQPSLSESLPTVMLLLDAKANIEAPDQNGWTALHIAASKGNKELVSLLLSRGAQVNATTTANQTPILMAACNGHTQVVQELIKASTLFVFEKNPPQIRPSACLTLANRGLFFSHRGRYQDQSQVQP